MIMLLGFLFMILTLCLSGVGMPTLLDFIDMVSLTLIVVPLIFFMAVTKTHRSVIHYFKCSFKKNYNFSGYELECLSRDLGAVIRYILALGVFGFITGLICLLASLSDPSVIGPSLAVSLISELYSVMIAFFIFYPVKIWAECKLRAEREPQ